MSIWEREELKRAMFWAASRFLAEVGGTMLGILDILESGEAVPAEEVAEAARGAGVSEEVFVHALTALIYEGLVRIDGAKGLISLNQSAQGLAQAAREWKAEAEPLGLVELLRSLAEAGEKALRAC